MRPKTQLPQPEKTTMKLADIKPAAKNPRKITGAAANALRESIQRWGIVQPLIVNKKTGQIVGGHQRYAQMLAIGVVETEVVLVDLSEDEEKLLNVTLNNPHAQGKFDDAELEEMLSDLDASLDEDMKKLAVHKLLPGELSPKTVSASGKVTEAVREVKVFVISTDETTYEQIKPDINAIMEKHDGKVRVEVTYE